MLISLEVLFKRAGFAVVLAEDGECAVQRTESSSPDIVLLDVMMPRKDGFSVCQQLRADPRFADLPVVMMSAKGREADRIKGLALGATDYIVKPFSTRDLLERVSALLPASPA